MAKKLFEKGNPGKPKGAINKVTISFKEALESAFEYLKDDPKHGLIAFAKEHPKDFYNIMSKLLPLQLNAKVEAELKVITGMVIK